MLILQHGIVNYSGGVVPTGDTYFKFQITTTTPSRNITIPHLSGYVYDYIIDWGDGSPTNHVTSYNDTGCTHTYENASAYTASISGTCETFYVNANYQNIMYDLTEILQWGNVGIIKINLYNCYGIRAIPTDTLGGFAKVTDFSYAFANIYDTNFKTIPEDLFKYAISATTFAGVFNYCPYLTGISANLFRYNTLATNFSQAFSQSYGITSIPTNLFRYNTLATNFSGTFSYWYYLTSLPADLFKYNVNATNFSQTFYYCYSLSSLPEGLFTGCTSASQFEYTFYACSGLATLPNKLFPTSAAYFYQTFYQCVGLSTVPEGLFTGCTSAWYFYQTFYQCAAITSTVPTLWVTFPSATGTDCFAGCTNASNYSSVPEEWGGLPINMKLQITTTGANQTITIPHLTGTGYTHNYFVDYGDGYTYVITGATDPNCTHTYGSANAYTIKISGVCETFFMSSGDTMFTGLTKVLQWGRVSMKKMNFSGSTTLVDIASSDPMYGLSGVTDFINVFAYCTNINGAAPSLWTLYSGKTGTNCFTGDTNLYNYSYIPIAWGGLGGTAAPLQFEIRTPGDNPFSMYLPLKQKNYAGTYTYNYDFDIDWGDGTGISHISSYNDPNNYHYYATGGTFTISISGVCETIDTWQGSYTYYLTQTLKKIKQWGQVQLLYVNFMSCSYLTDVLATDGKGASLITDWSYSFYNCTSLTGLTAGMFSGCTKITTFSQAFYYCTALASIPSGLFDDCINVQNMQYVFFNCTSLASIPAGLFNTITGSTIAIISFDYCFYNCTSLTGAAPELWLVSPPPSLSGSGCFQYDTGLSNYSDAVTYGWA